MSSHREAPGTSKDPVVDSTDVYAFVSPVKPDTVTIIANYIALQGPTGGPNFFEFGDDVLYSIHIDNNGGGGLASVVAVLAPAIGDRLDEGQSTATLIVRARTAKYCRRSPGIGNCDTDLVSMGPPPPIQAPGRCRT